MIKIFFVYAENCEHCNLALSTIESAMKKYPKTSCEILKFHYDSKAAISIAINKGISDLPGFVIGDDVYIGENYSEERIIESIKKASK